MSHHTEESLNEMASSLLEVHKGLADDVEKTSGWKVLIGVPRRLMDLGICSYDDRIIWMNQYHVESDRDETVEDTLIHEVAHVLAGIEINPDGKIISHGKRWKTIARTIGCYPFARKFVESSKWNIQPPKYAILYNDGTKRTFVTGRNRKPRNFSECQVKGHPETKGRLEIIEYEKWVEFQNDGSNL